MNMTKKAIQHHLRVLLENKKTIKESGLIMEGIKFGNIIKIFLDLNEKENLDRNCRLLSVSYSWLYNTLKEMEEKDLVMIDKVGRENIIRFTPRGRKVREHLKEIMVIINGGEV